MRADLRQLVIHRRFKAWAVLPGKRDSVGLGGSDCPKLYSRSVYLPLEYSKGYQTKGGALLLAAESTKTHEGDIWLEE